MNKIEQLSWLIEQNKNKREELKQKESEYKQKREALLQRLKKDKSEENQKKLSIITQKLGQVSQSLLEVRRKNKELHRERGIVYKSQAKKKKSKSFRSSSDETKLSSHSIVQYLDRGRGMDIESIRDEVSNSGYTTSNLSGTLSSRGSELTSGDVSYTANSDTYTASLDGLDFGNTTNFNNNSRLYASNSNSVNLQSFNSEEQGDEDNSQSGASDFEVVSYLSDTGAIDIDKVKSEIIDDDVEPLINSDELIGSSGTFTNSSGYRLVVRNGTIVTVLPQKGSEKDKKPKRRQKRKKKRKKK